MKKDYDSTRIYRNTHKKRVRHRLMTHPHVRRKNSTNMKKIFILILVSIFMEAPLYAQKYSMQSPDGHIALTISNQEQLTY